jgi:hypothetical protein
MVYRSFGKEVPQDEIWPLIAKPNRFGSIASSTHLMVAHALSQGLQAIAIQARHPLQVLRLCRDGGIRAILNLRLQADAYAGHYAVLADIDDKYVVLHDPLLGPARPLTHAELLARWHPQVPNSEILGNVVIGIAPESAGLPPCEFCHTLTPVQIDCPRCAKSVGLQPALLMGCMLDGCIARMWNYVCCPSCDYVWTFNNAGEPSTLAHEPAGPVKPPASEPENFDLMFAELDKFCSYIRTIPGAAEHKELNRYLDTLSTGKQQIQLAQAESLGYQKIREDQMTALGRDSEKRQEAHRKKVEALNTPPPPLDGNALGQALLKNLGFK